jgi:hypothetical protein
VPAERAVSRNKVRKRLRASVALPTLRVRYLGIEIDDAIEIAVKVDI